MRHGAKSVQAETTDEQVFLLKRTNKRQKQNKFQEAALSRNPHRNKNMVKKDEKLSFGQQHRCVQRYKKLTESSKYFLILVVLVGNCIHICGGQRRREDDQQSTSGECF